MEKLKPFHSYIVIADLSSDNFSQFANTLHATHRVSLEYMIYLQGSGVQFVEIKGQWVYNVLSYLRDLFRSTRDSAVKAVKQARVVNKKQSVEEQYK